MRVMMMMMMMMMMMIFNGGDGDDDDADDDDHDELWLLLLDCPIYSTPDRSASEKHNKNQKKWKIHLINLPEQHDPVWCVPAPCHMSCSHSLFFIRRFDSGRSSTFTQSFWRVLIEANEFGFHLTRQRSKPLIQRKLMDQWPVVEPVTGQTYTITKDRLWQFEMNNLLLRGSLPPEQPNRSAINWINI